MHGAGYALDPELVLLEVHSNEEVMGGLMTIAARLLGEENAAKAMEEFSIYKCKEGLFANSLPWASVANMPSYGWWETYGATTPNLQRLAMKVLAQPSAACACERNWSTFDFIHSKKRNRLNPQRARDLVYVFSNRRLLDKIETIGYKEAPIQFYEDASSSDEDK